MRERKHFLSSICDSCGRSSDMVVKCQVTLAILTLCMCNPWASSLPVTVAHTAHCVGNHFETFPTDHSTMMSSLSSLCIQEVTKCTKIKETFRWLILYCNNKIKRGIWRIVAEVQYSIKEHKVVAVFITGSKYWTSRPAGQSLDLSKFWLMSQVIPWYPCCRPFSGHKQV